MNTFVDFINKLDVADITTQRYAFKLVFKNNMVFLICGRDESYAQFIDRIKTTHNNFKFSDVAGLTSYAVGDGIVHKFILTY